MKNSYNLGKDITFLGVLLFVISGILCVYVVVSMYVSTSYYMDWQRTIVGFSGYVAMVAIVLVLVGSVMQFVQKIHNAKRK